MHGQKNIKLAYYSTGHRMFETKFAELIGLQVVLSVRSFTFFEPYSKNECQIVACARPDICV